MTPQPITPDPPKMPWRSEELKDIIGDNVYHDKKNTPPADTNDGLDEIIGQLAGAASMCWEPTPTGVFDSEHARKYVKEAKAAINQHILDTFMELIGENEQTRHLESPAWNYINGVNDTKNELRKVAKERLKP